MKSSKAPLERKRPLFFLVGLVFALSVTLVSFEWRVPYKVADWSIPIKTIEEPPIELPPITSREKRKDSPKPEPPKVIKDPVEVKVVENDQVDAEDDGKFDIPDVMDEMPAPVESGPEADVVDPNEVFTVVEEMPSYPGGDNALYRDLVQRTVYPKLAKEIGSSGVVYVQYVVDQDGNVTDVKVVRGVDQFLDKEAVRVVKTLKGYKPGRQRGKPVRVQFTVPIRFELI